MELNKVIHGNCLDVIKTFPDKSIDCVITSPPYWQLRDYKWYGQWGLEPTFEMYLENLWSLMDELHRVLKDEGTCWINLGDTYSGGGGGNYGDGKNVNYCDNITGGKIIKNIQNKCLLLIPHRFGIGCIDRGWLMRNDIVWAKRNAMPESVSDRFSKKHEYFFFMTKQGEYFFNLEEVKDKTTTRDTIVRNRDITKLNNTPGRTKMAGLKENNYDSKNPGTVSDFWNIPTQPSSDDHFAAYNDRLVGKPIVSGCPQGGIVLDPFCGTATTGCRAIELGRKFIGIEGSEKYVIIANKNLAPYIAQQSLF